MKIISTVILAAFAISIGACAHSPTQDENARMALTIGTLHKAHLTEATYPVQTLRFIIEQYKPDLVLVEIRPEAFARGNLEDGAFEMTYAALVAQQAGIPVAPIDQWTEAEQQKELSERVNKNKEKQFKEELEKIQDKKGYKSAFVRLHSPNAMVAQARIINLRARIFDGNPSWEKRQAWFHYHADQAIQKYQAKRVLAFVGYEHRSQLDSHLRDTGFRIADPLRYDTRFQDLEMCVPAPVLTKWQEGVTRLRKSSLQQKKLLRQALQTKADYFQSAVDKYRGHPCTPL